MDRPPLYAPSAAKALEAILWLANEQPQIDVYHVVKACFFADKKHLAEWGRPIAGDVYDAAPWGPLPQVVYGLLTGNPMERLALENAGPLPFEVIEGLYVTAEREANPRRLSTSDVDSLRWGLDHVRGRSFQDIFLETHADPAYVRANGARMDYRDFIPDDDPDKAAKSADLSEAAPFASF